MSKLFTIVGTLVSVSAAVLTADWESPEMIRIRQRGRSIGVPAQTPPSDGAADTGDGGAATGDPSAKTPDTSGEKTPKPPAKKPDPVDVILESHTALDKAREESKGKAAIGTTGRGIGPA